MLDIPYKNALDEEILGYQYGYDAGGNRTFMRVAGLGADKDWKYSYDGLNRLISATRGTLSTDGSAIRTDVAFPPLTETWSLDSLGNWNAGSEGVSHHRFVDRDADTAFDSGTDDHVTRHHHDTDALNRITGETTDAVIGQPFLYDPAGNLVFDNQWFYVYDAFNRLSAIRERGSFLAAGTEFTGSPGAVVAQYEYDALNRRVRTTQRPGSDDEAVTRHVYAGGAQVLEEYSVAPNDDEALLRWFVHGESFPDPLLMVDVSPLGDHADSTPEYLWYLKDALGSTGALANLAGEIVEGCVYTPYGETTLLDEFNRPREVVAREAFFHDANFDGAIDGFDWVDLQTHLAAAEAGVFNPVALRIHDHNADGRLDAADEANFLAAWQPEDPAAAVPPQWRRPRGPVVDVLADGAYDVIDFLTFQTCLGRDSAACVVLFDINKDAVVDITDYELYAHTWSGPDEPHNFARGSKYGNPFLWTGQRYETETGLYHFVYRSYSPTLGRWLQRDPFETASMGGGHSGSTLLDLAPGSLLPHALISMPPSSLNLFEYSRSRAASTTDSLGLFEFTLGGTLVASGERASIGAILLGQINSAVAAINSAIAAIYAHLWIGSTTIAGIGSQMGYFDIATFSSIASEFASFVERVSQRGTDAVGRFYENVARSGAHYPDPNQWGRFQHTLDHAKQFFGTGGQPLTPDQVRKWGEALDYVSRSKNPFPWSSGAQQTVARLAQVDGKFLCVQHDAAGNLVTAFVPNPGQLQAMMNAISLSKGG